MHNPLYPVSGIRQKWSHLEEPERLDAALERRGREQRELEPRAKTPREKLALVAKRELTVGLAIEARERMGRTLDPKERP
jgi:hypothetical protein